VTNDIPAPGEDSVPSRPDAGSPPDGAGHGNTSPDVLPAELVSAHADDRGPDGVGSDDAGDASAWAMTPPDAHLPVAASLGARWIAGVVVAVVVALLGFPLGWLWSSVAPWLPVQVYDNALYYADPEGEQRAGAESWFIILSFGAGIVLAIIVWVVLRRFRGAIMAFGLGLGSVVTGWLAWRFGHTIGLGAARDAARRAKDGTILRYPPDLRIKSPGNVAHWHSIPYITGDVLYVAVAALGVYLLLVLVSVSPSLGLRRRA